MPYTQDELNSLYQAADYSGRQATGESIVDSAEDYLTKGTFSAAASAGVGLVNSAIGIGRSIGVTKSDYIDEAETIQAMAGQDTADFYRRHKVGVDMAGMVGSVVLTGAVATAGLRALQVAGYFGGTYELATGMRGADLVLGSSAVRSAAVTAIEGVESFSPLSSAMVGAYAQGFKQVLLENAVGIVAASLANNQNIALNENHDKGAFESTWEITKENVASGWFIGGTVAQGVGESLKVLGHVSKVVKATDLEAVQKFYGPVLGELGSFLGLEPGDALMRANKAKNFVNNSEEFAAAVSDPALAGRARRATEIVDMAIHQQIGRAVDGIKDPTARQEAVDQLLKVVNSPAEDNGADKLALLSSIGTVGKSSEQELATFYKKTLAPMLMYDLIGGNRGEVHRDLYARLLNHLIEGNPQADLGDAATVANTTAGRFSKASVNALGGAFTSTYGKAKTLLFGTLDSSGSGTHTIVRNSMTYASEERVASRVDLDLMNNIRTDLGLETLTAKEYSNITMMHELGHLKNNTPEFLRAVHKATIETPEIFEELYTLSNHARTNQIVEAGKKLGYDWSTAAKFRLSINDNPELLIASQLSEEVPGRATTIKELIADASSMFFSDKYREIAPKMAPSMAKVFKTSGAAALPWSDTRMFWNVRTGERLSSTLPGANDIGVIARTKTGDILVKSFDQKNTDFYAYDINIFAPTLLQTGTPTAQGIMTSNKVAATLQAAEDSNMIRKDYLQASAMYAAKSKENIWKDAIKLAEKDKTSIPVLTVDSRDLPSWEYGIKQGHKVIDDTTNGMLDAKIRIVGLDGKISDPLSLADAELELIAQKKVLRTTLASQNMNEEEIVHILNIDKTLAMGNDQGEWLLSKVKNFDKPEIFEMSYKPMDVPDQILRARSQTFHEINAQAVSNLQQTVAGELLSSDLKRFVSPTALEGKSFPTQTESRVGLFNSAKNTFDSMRSVLSAIGKATADTIRAREEEILKAYQGLNSHFQAAENYQSRALLATADNFVRQHKSILAKFDDGSHALIPLNSLEEINGALREARLIDDTESLRDLAKFNDLPTNMKDFINSKNSMMLDRSSRVGEFYEAHRGNNARIIYNKSRIAVARGGSSNLQDDIIYAAPMDLKATPHVAFVIPNDIYAQHDPSKYMVYGSSAQELEEKINSIYKGVGDRYKVVYGNKGGDVELYKKMVGDYDRGQIFDEQFFDAAKFKTGSSAQLKPNLDLNVSSTFNRYMNWTIRQEEYAVRSAVELRYADTVAQLQWMDRAARRTEQGLFGAKKQESIYKDSINMMLDIRSQGSEGQQLWKKVNDFVGEKGSDLLYTTWKGISNSKTQLTQEKFDSINSTLATAGIESPYSTINSMILASPDVMQNRQLNGLVRTMNTITATLGLRLDVANSIVNVVSASILSLPVLRTAMRDLPKGSTARTALEELTSVRVPGSNLREPSAMKLLLSGTKAFLGAKGKAKVAECAAKGLVPDFMTEYLNVMDDLALSGSHTVSTAMEKFSKFADFGAKLSGHTKTEGFTRFLMAHAVEELGKARGLSADEIFVAQVNAIDQVHGIHRYAAKPQLFNGVVGQAIGLYQTYAFNMLHSLARYVTDGDRANAAIMVGLQTSIFGLQGLPGFSAFNNSIMRSNGRYFDAYNLTGADQDDKGLGSYLLYGSASHIFSTPVDLASRGGTTPRNPLLVPTNFLDIPSVSIFAKGVKNIVDTVQLANNDNVSAADAVLHGLAHNGFSRPLQGLANIARGYTDTAAGQPLFTNVNHVNYDELEELNFAAITARLIGTRPLKETMLLNTKYRQDAFQGELRKRSEALGAAVKLSLASGEDLSRDMVRDYALQYSAAGLPVEGFNSFWGRQLSAVTQKDMNTFRQTLEQDEVTKNVLQGMRSYRSTSKHWEELGRLEDTNAQSK